MKILVTGADGFIGKNLCVSLAEQAGFEVLPVVRATDPAALESKVAQADAVIHLAGVNRPQDPAEFAAGNADFTARLCQALLATGRPVPVAFASSIQADRDNPYGLSKRAAEDHLRRYAEASGAPVALYRLANVFGKWSRPDYNSAVATFCHNIARGLPIQVNDAAAPLRLVYIDDVVAAFLRHLDGEDDPGRRRYTVSRTFRVTLGDLAERIRQLHRIRASLVVPDMADELMHCLHATYLSFLPEDGFAYPVRLNTDDRGWLFELLKSEHFGQIFVSRTRPGITRGDHYHDSKLEKFCVIQGEAVIRFRHIHSQEILEYPVSGTDIRVVDIPPGHTHSIENVGQDEMICLFWANRVFSPQQPDTFWEKVQS